MIRNRGLAHGLDEQLISSFWDWESAQIQRVNPRSDVAQRHQVLTIRADVHRIMINRVFVSADGPLQRVSVQTRCKREAVVDPRFDLRCLFIIVPGHQLKIRERFARIVKIVDFGKCLQPGLPALLRHYAVRSPGSVLVVEAFVGGSDGLNVRVGHSCLIEARQVRQTVVGSGWHDPGITAVRQVSRKSVIVLEDQHRLRAHLRERGVPVYGRVRKVDVELSNYWLALHRHVGRRSEVGLFDVLQVIHQCLLRRATAAGIPLDRSLVDHDREGETGMGFGLCHDLQSGLIQSIARSIPVEDHAIDAPVDHVVNLALNFGGIGGVVADVHVVRLAEPEDHVGINFRSRTGVKQRVDINLAHIPGAEIAIR